MQDLQSPFCAGQDVVVRDEPWRVIATEAFERVTLLTLRGIGVHNRGDTRRVLAPFDEATVLAPSTRLQQRSRRAVLATAARAIADAAEWGDCWTAAAAAIDLRPWQLEPAMAAVRGATRILLADDVGLGKTIQASLIVSELFARGLAHRGLVLTPASLRDQWAGEMSSRFRLAPAVFDHAALVALQAAAPATLNPWKTAPLIISSIDLVKRPEVRTTLDAVPIDVLVVDEAHHLTPGSDRAAVVSNLAARTAWLVLATATPHSGDDAGYRFLLALGEAGGDALVMFRRSAMHVRTAPPRRSKLLAIRPTGDERAMLTATMEYARALWRTRDASEGAGLVAAVIARRAASSAAAARKTLQRRLQLLEGEAPMEIQAALPWEETGCEDADVPDAVLAVPGFDDRCGEIDALVQLVALATAAEGSSSKLSAIRRLLRRCCEPLLIFSEYRDVVELVARGVDDLAPTAVLHGGLPPRQRRDAVRAFTEGSARVLVATDAAGEGLNLHQRCRLVVNLELPWNPQRLEQRIGRVDRLGQTRRVHAIHLVHHDSFEARVVARLAQRSRNAQLPAAAPIEQVDVPAARERRLREIAVRSACAVYASRGRRGRHVHLVFTTNLVDGSGRHVRRHVSVIRARTTLRTLSRSHIRLFAAQPDVVNLLQVDVARAVAATHASCAETSAALERRCRGIARALAARRQQVVYQGSLFDRRAEQHARCRQSALLDLQAHVARRIADAVALGRVTASTPQLVAVWLGE